MPTTSKINISGKSILFLGIGSIGSCCINYFNDFFIGFEHQCVTLVDMNVKVKDIECVKKFLENGANFIELEINRLNFIDLLDNICKLKEGDIIIDLTTQTKSLHFLKCSIERNIHYFNSALNEDYIQPISGTSIQHMYVTTLNSQYTVKATCIIETGMNPGLVSSFAKKGVRSITKKLLSNNKFKNNIQYKSLSDAYIKKNYALMAKYIGLKIIACSENDTQIPAIKPNSPFFNTWSNIGLIEEYLEPLEVGLGNHEISIPFENNDEMMLITPNLFIAEHITSGTIKIGSVFVDSLDENKKPVFSYGYGRCIRHGECVSMSRYFSTGGYSPSVYFSYKLNPFAESIFENTSIKNLFALMTTPNLEILTQVYQVDGYDNVGALLVYEDPIDSIVKTWWSGSIFNVNQVKTNLNDNYFLPTQIQVMAGVFSAVSYAIENPNNGILFCEELDEKYILNKVGKYLGTIYNGKTNIDMKINYEDLILNKTGNTDKNLI